MITDDIILDEAIRLVGEGVSVTFPVKGYSMLPFIIGGRESVILQRPADIRVGQVVLAWVDGSRYVVHRIISISGDRVVLMGDGNLTGTEQCRLADVKAVATHVVSPHGRKHNLYALWRLRLVRLWCSLGSLRRIPLGVMRRLLNIKYR